MCEGAYDTRVSPRAGVKKASQRAVVEALEESGRKVGRAQRIPKWRTQQLQRVQGRAG